METRPPIVLIILTLVAFAFPLYTQAIWALIAGSNTHEDHNQMFLRHFPNTLDIKTINYLTLSLSILTVLLAEWWRRKDTHLGKSIAFIIVMLAAVFAIITLLKIV